MRLFKFIGFSSLAVAVLSFAATPSYAQETSHAVAIESLLTRGTEFIGQTIEVQATVTPFRTHAGMAFLRAVQQSKAAPTGGPGIQAGSYVMGEVIPTATTSSDFLAHNCASSCVVFVQGQVVRHAGGVKILISGISPALGATPAAPSTSSATAQTPARRPTPTGSVGTAAASGVAPLDLGRGPHTPDVSHAKTYAMESTPIICGEGLCSIRSGSVWGFVNRSGDLVIPFQYLSAAYNYPLYFSDGAAAVVLNDGHGSAAGAGYIDKSGKRLFAGTHFLATTPFSEGISIAMVSGSNAFRKKYVLVDRQRGVLPVVLPDGGEYARKQRLDYAGEP